MSDRPFTNPNIGREVRVEQFGLEVHLIFVATTQYKSDRLVMDLLKQLKNGALNMTLLGKPTSIIKDGPSDRAKG